MSNTYNVKGWLNGVQLYPMKEEIKAYYRNRNGVGRSSGVNIYWYNSDEEHTRLYWLRTDTFHAVKKWLFSIPEAVRCRKETRKYCWLVCERKNLPAYIEREICSYL